jgi:hypothetical protein
MLALALSLETVAALRRAAAGGGGGATPALKFNVAANSQYIPVVAF